MAKKIEKPVDQKSLLKMLSLLLSHKKEDRLTASKILRENPGIRKTAQQLVGELKAKDQAKKAAEKARDARNIAKEKLKKQKKKLATRRLRVA